MLARTRHRLVLLALTASFVQSLLALEMSQVSAFYGGLGRDRVLDDVRLYERYGSRALRGEIPYRDYLVEYPPLSVLVFLLAGWIASQGGPFPLVFAIEMLLFQAATMILLAFWIARHEGADTVPRRLAWSSLSFLTLCPLAVSRFDLAPACLAFAAASAWFSGREIRGGMAAAAGTLLKIFPGTILVPGLVWDFRRFPSRRGRGLVTMSLLTVAGLAAWRTVGGSRVVGSLRYHAERGLEIGSLPTGLLLLWHRVSETPARTEFLHSSTELVAPGASALAAMAFPLQVLALVLVFARAWRARLSDPMRWAGAAILGFIAFGKVLSPQYLLWCLPFIAATQGRMGRRARMLTLILCLLTTLLYPWGANRLVSFDLTAILALNVRNFLLLGLWTLLLFGNVSRLGSSDTVPDKWMHAIAFRSWRIAPDTVSGNWKTKRTQPLGSPSKERRSADRTALP